MKQFKRYLQTLIKVVFRRPLTGVTLIPLLSDGRIVLIQRRDSGQWGLPGGLIDWGETIEMAAERELKEETGLKLSMSPRLFGVYSSLERDPRMHSIAVTLVVQAHGEMQSQDPLEVLDVKAFSRHALPLGHLSHDHDHQLTDFLANQKEIILR